MDLFFEQFKIPRKVITLDIETEGTGHDAVIATIGAVITDIVTGQELSDFYIRCKTEEQIYIGRKVTKGTQEWWASQREHNQEAFDEAFCPYFKRYELKTALEQLALWIRQTFPEKVRPAVFGNGPEFDNSIIDHAFTQFEMKTPWDHGCNQSVRTMVWMGRVILGIDPKGQFEFEGIQHHALDDARHEAKQIHYIFESFVQLKERLHWLTDNAIGEETE